MIDEFPWETSEGENDKENQDIQTNGKENS